MPANTVYVGRPSVWGNPFVVGSELIGGEKLSAEKSIALYRQYAREAFNERDLRACLRGKNLACWCPLDQPCTMQLGNMPGNGGRIQVGADGQVGDAQCSGC